MMALLMMITMTGIPVRIDGYVDEDVDEDIADNIVLIQPNRHTPRPGPAAAAVWRRGK